MSCASVLSRYCRIIHYLTHGLQIILFIVYDLKRVLGQVLDLLFNNVEKFLKTFLRKYFIYQFNAEIEPEQHHTHAVSKSLSNTGSPDKEY